MTGDAPSVSRLVAGPFPAIEERLLSRLSGLLTGGGRWEHVLLIPSNELREHLLRRLAGRWQGVAAGISIQTLYDFALRLLKHRGLFPRELPQALMSAALSAAVREVYADGRGDFATIAGTPGFLPALFRTLADLEEGWLGPEALLQAEREALGEGRTRKAERWAEWRRIALAFDRKVQAVGGMTRRRIFQEAVAGFEQPGYPFRVSLYGFYDFTRLQWILVDALLSGGLLEEAYFPGIFREDGSLSFSCFYALRAWDRLSRAFEGNVELVADPAPPQLRAVRERIFSVSPPETLEAAPVTILSAPHEEGEARLSARQVRRWLRDHPEDDVLLVSRRFGAEAVSAWERAAAEYGIPTVERLTVPLASVPPVRVLLEMIGLVRDDFPRRRVIDVLSSPYRRPAVKGPAPPRPDLWDVWSRELLIVSGSDWEKRLSRLRAKDPEEGEEGEGKGHAAQLALLAAEVRALRASLRPLRSARDYRGMARILRRLLVGHFRFIDDDGHEGERDRRALSALLALLDDIERIPPGAVPWPGADEALSWFEGLLAGERLFVGERGGMRVPGAVVAGDLNALRGVTADRVIFLSVNEDLVPAQIDEDPLLPDEDRETLNRLSRQAGLPDALSLMRRNASLEKLLFALPPASARREIAYSVLRADALGAVKLPSRYLLGLLAQFAGPGVFGEEWKAKANATVRNLPRSPFAMLRAEGPLSAREEALRGWSAGVPPQDGTGGIPWRRIAAILSEWRTRREGVSLFPVPGPAVRRPEWSATEADLLARCPYRYFLRFRLGLSPVEEPEEELFLTPAESGILLHDILRILGEAAVSGEGWGDAAPAARKAFARFAREHPTGLPGLFLLRSREILRDATAFVEWERGCAGGPAGWRVAAVESGFSVAAGNGLPAFRGRVDRIDRGPSGEAGILDYKYRDGTREKSPIDWIGHGLANQIPVYLVFARTLSPPPTDVQATLLFLKNGVRTVTVDGDGWKAVQDEWSAALSWWIGLDRSGRFPPLPHHRFSYAGSPPPRYCDPCPFADHCRVSPRYEGTKGETEALVRRVGDDPALRGIGEHRPATR